MEFNTFTTKQDIREISEINIKFKKTEKDLLGWALYFIQEIFIISFNQFLLTLCLVWNST